MVSLSVYNVLPANSKYLPYLSVFIPSVLNMISLLFPNIHILTFIGVNSDGFYLPVFPFPSVPIQSLMVSTFSHITTQGMIKNSENCFAGQLLLFLCSTRIFSVFLYQLLDIQATPFELLVVLCRVETLLISK